LKIDDSTEIARVEIIDRKTNERTILSEKGDSRCFFLDKPLDYEDVKAGIKYRIRLRLDQNDLDKNGNPMLDADVSKIQNEREIKIPKSVGKKQGWHHTTGKIDPQTQERVYYFSFQAFNLEITVIKTIRKFITSDSCFCIKK